MKLRSTNIVTSPCAPFRQLPGSRMSRMQAQRFVVKSQARNDSRSESSLALQLGRFCAPFAAAVLLLAQGPAPALADSNPVADTFDNSLKRQQELGSKLDFNAFFNKAKDSAKNAVDVTKDASDPSKAATEVPQKIPTFGKPVESSASVKKVAEDAANKINPAKPDTAKEAVKETVSSGADKADAAAENVQKSVGAQAPGENAFRNTAKEGVKDNTGSASNSNQQASAAPAFSSKEEEKSFAKAEKEQEKAEKGDPSKPRLDPSIVEGEPEPGPAPGVQNKLPDQPVPEKGSYTQLGKDSSGGKVQETKRGSGPLDLFGGGPSGETPTSKAESLIEKAEEPQSGNLLDFLQKGLGTSSLPQDKTNNVGSLAELEPPQPSEVIEKLPESAPGDQNDLPDQPAPESPPPEELGKDSAGGATGSTKSGGGILDFFGGSSNNQSALPQAKSGTYLASLPIRSEAFTIAGLEPPQPTELDEPEPKAAPGEDAELAPDQPRPEPVGKQTPNDSPGGRTEDTKRGDGPLDLFGGPDSGNAKKAAEKNVQKAAAYEFGELKTSEVAQIAEEEAAADEGKVVIIGVLFSIALEIAIFSTYKQPEGHGGHH